MEEPEQEQSSSTSLIAPATKDTNVAQISTNPKKSVEGWIVFATGISPETEPDDVERIFAQFGLIHSIHLNVDRRTGYLKGYAFVEYENYKSAQDAIYKLNGTNHFDQTIKVDWCFIDRK